MSAPATPWRAVLIVEDETDGIVLKRLAEKLHGVVRIDPLPARGSGEIKRRLAQLVGVARDAAGERGCVAVVMDADGHDPEATEPHRSILEGCRKQCVPVFFCKKSIEAWLLTDPGVRRFLDIKPTEPKQSTERLGDPKAEVKRAFFQRTGRAYEKRVARRQLADRLEGPRVTYNESLGKAVAHLGSCDRPARSQEVLVAGPVRRPLKAPKGR